MAATIHIQLSQNLHLSPQSLQNFILIKVYQRSYPPTPIQPSSPTLNNPTKEPRSNRSKGEGEGELTLPSYTNLPTLHPSPLSVIL